MRVTVSGVEKMIADITKQQKKLTEEAQKSQAQKLVQALKANTPVDTGEARDGWRIDEKGDIANDVEHIAALNNGHSQQAPAHFVEKTVLAFPSIQPNGVIVSHK